MSASSKLLPLYPSLSCDFKTQPKKELKTLSVTGNGVVETGVAYKRKNYSLGTSEEPTNKKNCLNQTENSNVPIEPNSKNSFGIREFQIDGTNQQLQSIEPKKISDKQRYNHEKDEVWKNNNDTKHQENKQISCQIGGMSVLNPNPRHTNDKEVLWKDRKDATEQENRHISSQVWGKLVSPDLPPLHPTLRTDEKTLLINELGTVKTTIKSDIFSKPPSTAKRCSGKIIPITWNEKDRNCLSEADIVRNRKAKFGEIPKESERRTQAYVKSNTQHRRNAYSKEHCSYEIEKPAYTKNNNLDNCCDPRNNQNWRTPRNQGEKNHRKHFRNRNHWPKERY
ncbi:hypothetical protein QYM36_002327 [Artemia franciscana]|uniref:Uncharacterized protein n=1 Tax=Artemia franciscana TaxID=6661 RepID=A0AA88LEV3_ARTSF|nr:hypothetical protein QYM36_002327 [Artemia franciscana]